MTVIFRHKVCSRRMLDHFPKRGQNDVPFGCINFQPVQMVVCSLELFCWANMAAKVGNRPPGDCAGDSRLEE